MSGESFGQDKWRPGGFVPGRAFARVILIFVAVAAQARGGDIQGTVIIQRRLTKARVTPTSDGYSRGVAVELRSDTARDVLSFERSHVAIYLEGPPASKSVTAAIAQKDRQFIPDMISVPAGSTVSFPNLDPIFHNVFSLSGPKEFDLGNYSKDHTRTVTFPKPGIVFLNCHLHPNMAAVIVIAPNEWSVMAGPDGEFRLAGIPAGTYTLVAWHKTAGYFRQRVTVAADRVTPVTFFIPLSAESTVAAR